MTELLKGMVAYFTQSVCYNSCAPGIRIMSALSCCLLNIMRFTVGWTGTVATTAQGIILIRTEATTKCMN